MDAETLVKKLVKSGKHAELWAENSESKKKKKQKGSKDDETASDVDEKQTENTSKDNSNTKENQKGQPETEVDDTSGDDHTEEKGSAPEIVSQNGGGGGNGGKKKKKKKKKKGNAGSTNAGGAPVAISDGSPAPAGIMGPPADQVNLNPPRQHIFSYPQFYYAAPEYGMSYNTAPPTASMTSSYYSMPMHSYTYSAPHYYPPPPSDPLLDTSRYNDDYYGDDQSGCSIM